MSKFGNIDRANLRKLEISSPIQIPCNGSVVPVPTTQLPTQSMLENNTVKNAEISNPVIQPTTKKNMPVRLAPTRPAPSRPAPPRPTTVIAPPRTSSQELKASHTKVINNPKNDVSRASSLNCKESGRRPPTRPPTRPACLPTLEPPPSYWEITSQQNGAKAEHTIPKPGRPSNAKPDLDRVNSVKHNKVQNTQNNLVAALTEKFENSASVCTDSNNKNVSKNYLSDKNDKHLNAKC